MNLGYILFSPNGRIGPGAFWRGIIVLLGIGIGLNLLMAYGSMPMMIGALVLMMLLVYPYICVFGKRLHDSGKSAWIFLFFLIGYIVLSWIMGALTTALIPGQAEAQLEMQEKMTALQTSADPDVGLMFSLIQEQMRDSMILSIVTGALTTFIVAFFAARMFSYPEANQYGPPPGGLVSAPDDDFL